MFTYDTIFVAPKRAEMLKKSQATAVQGVTKESPQSAQVTTTAPTTTQISTFNYDDLKEIGVENQNVAIKSTSMGGMLHFPSVKGSKHPLPLVEMFHMAGQDNKNFVYTKQDNNSQFLFQNGNSGIKKTYKANADGSFLIRMETQAEGNIDLFTIDISTLAQMNNREAILDELSFKTDSKVTRKSGLSKFSSKDSKQILGSVAWVGFRDHYNALVLKPEFATKGIEMKQDTEKRLIVSILPESKNATAVYEFSMYVGPQDVGGMKKFGKGFEEAIAFSNFAPIDWVAKGIYFTIPFLQSIIKSWGFSIILISLMIYGITYPLTFKSMMSMRKMQEVQPKVKALQEKYKSDPQKLNAEIMDIYRREKVNPLGGCLPFLAQMPIFIALYQVLWRAYYFQGKSFLWIKDLAQPDRLFILPFSLPFLGQDFNILPILMACVMFAQQKLSAKNMVVTDETQAMQQKVMTIFFPIFIGFIFYKFASALSLYFTVFYLLSTLTQWKLAKITKR